ncbi:hypothetical protein B0H13DRAFT_1919345 [Mycena leptocephala]|nr:hypothetical protein B0H13DRAFT_1919345 [Mycena leptocephala]
MSAEKSVECKTRVWDPVSSIKKVDEEVKSKKGNKSKSPPRRVESHGKSMCRWWCHRLQSQTAIASNNLFGGCGMNPCDVEEHETSAGCTRAWDDEFLDRDTSVAAMEQCFEVIQARLAHLRGICFKERFSRERMRNYKETRTVNEWIR